jgi:hypothetical protein
MLMVNRGMQSPARHDGFCLSLIATIEAQSGQYILGHFLASGLWYDFTEDLARTILEIEGRGKRGVGYCKSMPGGSTVKANRGRPTACGTPSSACV